MAPLALLGKVQTVARQSFYSTQLPISAVEIEQRLTGAALRPHHLAEQNGMVPGIQSSLDSAFEPRQGAFQQRSYGYTRLPCDSIESAFGLFREGHRQAALRIGQNVHGEIRSAAEVLERLACEVDADQDQRRTDGNCRKRTDCQPVRLAIRGPDGGHGDAGRKL